jgi:hypothetical protein
MNLLRIYSLTGATLIATAGIMVWLGGSKKTPEQREMLRRQQLSTRGRITDGTVLDVRELESPAGEPMQTILYSYDVAGVHYECAQEVTHLRQFIDPQSCVLGSAASVRYDAQQPLNSIVVAEGWCGLRIVSRPPVFAPPISSLQVSE